MIIGEDTRLDIMIGLEETSAWVDMMRGDKIGGEKTDLWGLGNFCGLGQTRPTMQFAPQL